MESQWNEVATLRFKGERFHDHALDLSAVTELRQFQKMIAETAKALWLAANPERKNLPAHFEERTRLCLRRIDPGSAVVPLEVFRTQATQPELWEPEPEEINQALDLAYDVFESLGQNGPLPEQFPKDLVPAYSKWGETLGPGEFVEFQPTRKQGPTRLDSGIRKRLAAFTDVPHVSTYEVVGEVLEADVKLCKFQVWTDSRNSVAVVFDESQEEIVTQALKDHRCIRIHVRGQAEVSSQGKPIRFTEVSTLELESVGGPQYDSSAPSIEDEIAQIAAGVSLEAWDRLPTDLNDNLDHYLYGTPKQ